MTVVFAGLILVALAAYLVWRAAERFWQLLVILVMAALLAPVAATLLTGDVSRYFPAEAFSNGADGKDQIVLASAGATILIAVIVAAGLWSAAKTIWRRLKGSTN